FPAINVQIETAGFQVERDPLNRQWTNAAAFALHQAVERAYGCFLLTYTFYFPRSHNIKFLRSLAEDKEARLIAAWPRDSKIDRRRFELLKRAYVEARYSPLCRVRHNFDYAERHSMPSGRGMPAL